MFRETFRDVLQTGENRPAKSADIFLVKIDARDRRCQKPGENPNSCVKKVRFVRHFETFRNGETGRDKRPTIFGKNIRPWQKMSETPGGGGGVCVWINFLCKKSMSREATWDTLETGKTGQATGRHFSVKTNARDRRCPKNGGVNR